MMGKLIFAAAVILVGILIYALVQEAREWNAYASQHHCVIKGRQDSSIEPVMGGNGGFTYESGKDVYVCDGGEIVIR
jgi:hypothetical protein